MFNGSFGPQNSKMAIIFKFNIKNDPRKGQLHVKLGQLRSNFKIQNFHTKKCLSCAVFHRILKMSLIFMYNYKYQKSLFKNVTSLLLPVFFYHCTAKNKDIVLK